MSPIAPPRRPAPVLVAALAVAGLLSVPYAAFADEPAEDPTGPPALIPWFPGTAHGQSFSEGAITALAEHLASKPFVPDPPVPQELIDLDYDAYRKIAWKPEMSLWRYLDAPIQAELMHRGDILRNKVQINTVQDGKVVTLAFDRNLFEYRGDVVGLPVDAGVDYAGMKLIGPLPGAKYLQEFFAFAGASYFRGISAGQVYGASARALAIDIGTPRVEEFPIVRGLWLQRPEVDAKAARVWAILDSHAVAGAYRFDVTPGDPTKCEVRATLFFRHVPTKVAVAPASSMFLWGDGFENLKQDARPEVHDSDGLLVHAGVEETENPNGPTEWTFRALGQQSYPSVSGRGYGSIRGFGLLQRDRDPARYADPETRYEDRPSLWITPLPPDPFGTGPGAVNGADWDDVPNVWAGGTVELLEYPTDFEGFDNIAAWWVPAVQPTVGEPYPMAYTLNFVSGDPPEHELGKAAAWTRSADPNDPKATRLTVDFVGVPKRSNPAPRVTTQGGTDTDIAIIPMANGTRRVTLTIKPDADGPVTVDVALFPKSSEETGEGSFAGSDSDVPASASPGELSSGSLSETWRFLCPPLP
ncbi:glucan biosynthesis protein [Alienimonas californiensis]|uniref:Glucans biosynthesis protein G n=1 Tax=Alienimonas californiensis TaxID=2527989 RepID=A0A517P4N8_9PLAN|nr:glucan biosynthesis protein [Alienimonas californiensis]QDT14339.1 Glucans biosynthesis protein G precursor [Alienimonas californiensis]